MAINSIVIDSREPHWVQQLTFGGVPVAVAMLEAGDVMIATDDNKIVLVERKTADDLLNTIKDGRLFPQAAKMKAVSPWCYLVITGELTQHHGKVMTDHRITGWNWDSVQGALLTAQELGVGVIFADDFEQAVIRLASRDREDVTIRPPRVPSILSEGEAALTALPGIGVDRLSSLLEHTGSPAWALTYLTDPDSDSSIDVPGIGQITRLRVRRALRLKENEKLSVITIE